SQEAETQAQREEEARLARQRESDERARRVRRRVVWTSSWVGLLLVLGSASELWQARLSMDSDARTFSMLAAQALNEEKFDSAMRYALAALPPTGAILPIPHDEPEAMLAQAASRSRLVGMLGQEHSVRHIALSPDGARMAVGLANNTVAIWDARNK